MEKRVLIAVVLSFLVLYLYQAFIVPPPASRPPSRQTQAQKPPGGPGAAPTSSPQTAGTDAVGQPASPQPAAAQPAAAIATLVAEPGERDVVVDTDTLRAVFSNRGAHLKSWKLKRYLDDAKRPVDLVPQTLRDRAMPFMLDTGNDEVDARLNGALYRVDGGGATSDPKTGSVLVGFEYRDASGLSARKTFTIAPKIYSVAVSAAVSLGVQPLNVAILMGPGLGDVETGVANQYLQKPQAILFRAGSVERHDAASFLTQPAYEGPMRWAGVDDHYFISTALLAETSARVAFEHSAVTDATGKTTHDFVAYGVNPAGAGASVTFFIGPKDFDLLQGVDKELVRAINFGIFAFIAVPLLRALNGINDYLGNYGWSIIALTFLINLAIFPLRHKSVVSMRKMQELQPEIKSIQDRYAKLKATDPEKQKMNAELMGLYKQRGVNPASGCVPMLLTMPILFAFYSLLSQAIELRGAPFALWIADLSVHDPLYVTPILMGITMVVQQRMTPSTADPVQQKMFMLMPVVFTGMFLWAPSGLVIYWFFSNLLAIGQQVVTNRIIGPTPVHAMRPPAERKIKKVGEGKSNGASS